jgi:hypothetical protein
MMTDYYYWNLKMNMGIAEEVFPSEKGKLASKGYKLLHNIHCYLLRT